MISRSRATGRRPARARRGAASARPAARALLLLLAACRPQPPADTEGDGPAASALREELIEMGRRDQAVRTGLNAHAIADTSRLRRMMVVDSANTVRLAELIREHGWPARSEVGEEAAEAAFLVVQHSPSRVFQAEALELLDAAAARGEADRGDVAMLTDRVLTGENRPQLYGTQFRIDGGKLVPYPIQDVTNLEGRRAAMGLPPMVEYIEMLRRTYDGAVLFDTTALRRDTAIIVSPPDSAASARTP